MLILFSSLKGKLPRPNKLISLTKKPGQKLSDVPRHVAFYFEGKHVIQSSPSKGVHVVSLDEWLPKYNINAVVKFDYDNTKLEDNIKLMYPIGSKYDKKAISYFTWRVTAKILQIFKNIMPKSGKNKFDKIDKAHCVELFDGVSEFSSPYAAKFSIGKGSHAMVSPNELMYRLKECPDFKEVTDVKNYIQMYE